MTDRKKPKESLDQLAKELIKRQPMFIPDEPFWSGDPSKIMDDDVLDDTCDEDEDKGDDGSKK
jgi:hypothetical protein